MEKFSIREYVSRVRAVNVVKCWPFDEDTDEEAAKSLLPPITIHKFIWWLDGLECFNSESSKFVWENGESSLISEDDVEDSDIDVVGGGITLKSLRSKTNPPKKRSILEIFEVAPPVERVSSDEEDENSSQADEFHEEINWGLKGKRNKKKKIKNKEIGSSRLKKVKKVIKNKMLVPNKENYTMFKHHAGEKAKKRTSACTRELQNDPCDRVSILKKKQRPPHLDSDKKIMTCKAFESIARSQHPGIPNHDGYHSKEFTVQQSKKCILPEAIQANHCGKQKVGELACLPLEAHCSSRHVNVIKNSSCSIHEQLTRDMEKTPPTFPPACFTKHVKTCNEPPMVLDGYSTENVCGPRRINEGFVGLPLNSQGELIKLNSSINQDFNETIRSSIPAAPSVGISLPCNAKFFGINSERRIWDSGTSSREQLNLFPVEGYLEERPAAVPSRLDIDELRNNEKTNHYFDLLKINDPSYCSEDFLCKEDDQVQISPGNEKFQSTMRLMGKEFVVGEGFEDGRIWKDKQIMGEHHFDNTSLRNVMMHAQNEPSFLETRGPMYSYPHFHCQTSLMNNNSCVPRKMNPVEELYPRLSPGNLNVVYRSESLFPGPFMSGSETRLFNLDSCLDMSPSNIQLINNQNLSHAPRSAIRFPFTHPDFEGHAQSSWNHRSHVNCSPLSFDIPDKGSSMIKCNQHPDVGGTHHPLVTHRATSCWTDSSAPVMSTQQALKLSHRGILPISCVHKRHENWNKIRAGTKSRIGIRGPEHCKKMRRQPSDVSNVLFMPLKMPSLGFDGCANFEGDVQDVGIAVGGLSLAASRSDTLMCSGLGDSKKEQTIYPWMDSQSGPTKLSAGAKHVLKACQQIDHSISVSTDPSNHPSAKTMRCRFPESENLTRTYEF